MEKTLIIDGKNITFKSNASFAYTFKNQFGYDILTKLLPIISEVLKSIDDIANIKQEHEKNYKEEKTTLIDKVDNTKDNIDISFEKVGEILENIYSLELTDIQNIIWSMAKIANKDIKEPYLWYSDFEEFDLIDTLKELMPMLLSSFVSKKKLQTIKALQKNISV